MFNYPLEINIAHDKFFCQRFLAMGLLLALAVAIFLLWPTRHGDNGVHEIRLMYPRGNLTGAMELVVAEFEEESRRRHAANPAAPIYRVVAGQHAERSGVARFVLSVAGDTPPDVYYSERATSADWIARGAFMALDDFIAEDKASGVADSPSPDRFYPGCWKSVTYDGKVFAVPLGLGNTALFYNKRLFEQAGIVYQDGPRKGRARPPETWDELLDAVRRLTQWEEGAARHPKIAGFLPLHGAGSLELFTALTDGALVDPQGRECRLDSLKTIDALSFLVELHKVQGGVQALRSMDLGQAGSGFDPFARGRLAMKVDYQWAVNWQAAIEPEMRFGVAPMPGRSRPARRSWATGWQASIPLGARNPRGAWALIRFLASDRGLELLAESQRQLTAANGRLYVPTQTPVPYLNERFARRYVNDNLELPSDARAAFDEFQRLLDVAEFAPLTPVYNLLAAAESQATERALFGEAPERALAESARLVRAELRRVTKSDRRQLPHLGWFALAYAILLAVGVAGAAAYGARGQAAARREGWAGWAFSCPWLLGFAAFTGGPIFFSLLFSLCDYDVLSRPEWLGAGNYRELFMEDMTARKALLNTASMAAIIPVLLAASLAIALLIQQTVRLQAFWQTVSYLPVIVPLVASALAWMWFLNSRGPLNQALSAIGLSAPDWLNNPNWSRPAVALVMLWTCGGSVLVWRSGLKAIPQRQYEAAALDGAGPLQRFWHVTLPHLTPYLRFNLLASSIAVLQLFGEAFIMTAGGPDQSSLFMNHYLFNIAFHFGRMGYACAIAWAMFVLAAGLAALQYRLMRQRSTTS